MATLVLGDPPAELRALIERRRRTGADRHDEVWAGVLHMNPAPSFAHAVIAQQLAEILGPRARAASLVPALSEFNLGDSEQDYRVPDGALAHPGTLGTWVKTVPMVVEIVSPDDETFAKLSFYAERQVREVLIVDPQRRAVTWLARSGGEFRPLDGSPLIGLTAAELQQQIDWP